MSRWGASLRARRDCNRTNLILANSRLPTKPKNLFMPHEHKNTSRPATARAERRALPTQPIQHHQTKFERRFSISKHRRRTVIWAVNPNPIFNPLAQTFADGIQQNVTGLLQQLIGIPQAMVEKIALPFHAMMRRHKMLPVFHRCFHSRLMRKRDDGV